MPDLPTPQDAAEAALFSECWDAVLSYADLCTSGSTAATRLATEAFSLGMREARDAESAPARGAYRRPARLPRIPLLLTAVRNTAAAWENQGQGHQLDPQLRLWLNSEEAARYNGPPLQRPLALRGLRDLQEPDAALLWLAEVEALPLTVVAHAARPRPGPRRRGTHPGTRPVPGPQPSQPPRHADGRAVSQLRPAARRGHPLACRRHPERPFPAPRPLRGLRGGSRLSPAARGRTALGPRRME